MLFKNPNAVWIVLTILQNVFDGSYAAFLRCYRSSFTDYTEVQLTSPDSLVTAPNPCIDKSKPTVFMINGLDNDPDHGEVIVVLMTTYISLGTHNVILLNWSAESKGIGVGATGYPTAVANTMIVGAQFAKATIRLLALGISRLIHYIGHSLGAQLASFAGRETKKNNFIIPWLTALDPARLSFDPPLLYPSVDTTSAQFVEVHLCDPGGYSINKTEGHVNILINYGAYVNGDRRQPGCGPSTTTTELATNGNSCSHSRCCFYYNVSLTSPRLFKAGRAVNYYDWVAHNGVFDHINYIGPDVNMQEEGDFFCSTSATEPWGLQDAGLVP